ncbi:hypothetical protein GALMADRAFT_208058 [Galerina marginata CBS 339.88]|uniref:Uncharacterized protein n=1 Tax=Galerina marginata (strain CBS 339.88) TaxID=685588 RepID=A0A067TDM4_GALM3|nr:hypothetical protein GALMADRAFT_208058 [Galerina marginata CBS 339.88]
MAHQSTIESKSISNSFINTFRYTAYNPNGAFEYVNIKRLNTYYCFYAVWVDTHNLKAYIDDPNCLVVMTDVHFLIFWFRFFTLKDLRLICKAHGMNPRSSTKAAICQMIQYHICANCARFIYVFKVLPSPRKYVEGHFIEIDPAFDSHIQSANEMASDTYVQSANETALDTHVQSANEIPVEESPEPNIGSLGGISNTATTPPGADNPENTDHLKPLDKNKKLFIIKEWEDELNTNNIRLIVCAACNGNKIDLTLLSNPCLPDRILPTSYDITAYKKALLNIKGLEYTSQHYPQMLSLRSINQLYSTACLSVGQGVIL